MTVNPSDPVALLQALIQCPSVTPADEGALGVVEAALTDIGFDCHRLTFSDPGTADIDNLFATIGDEGPNLAFAGHTDVVPPGDTLDWTHGPFSGAIVDDILYGRGAVDMKGGIASFIAAAAESVAETRAANAGRLPWRLSLLITGDEEAVSINGTVKLIKWADDHGHKFDACIVGEPTGVSALGDVIKVGRRGSLSGSLQVEGVQGHVAYPHKADNPIPKLLACADALLKPLDEGTDVFQPTNLEVTSIDTGNMAHNVIPARCRLAFNVRFNDRWTGESLEAELRSRLEAADPDQSWTLTCTTSGEAFRTVDEKLVASVSDAIEAVVGQKPSATTGGGTSDARFVKAYCPVIELGLVGSTMHQVDERVPVAELHQLKTVYRSVMDHYFSRA